MDAKRPAIISLLAVLQFIGGAFWLLGAIVGLVRAVIGSGEAQADAFMLVVAVLCGVIGGLQLACGLRVVATETDRPHPADRVRVDWPARHSGRDRDFHSASHLFQQAGIKVLFSGRPTSEWTQEEFAQVAALPQTSVAVVVILALVVGVGGVMVLGIVAAIAVPGLLRARISGKRSGGDWIAACDHQRRGELRVFVCGRRLRGDARRSRQTAAGHC